MPTWFPPVDTTLGNDCLVCVPPGQTPLSYYVSFFGIERGDLWLPWMGMPPSGWFQVTQDPVIACKWQLDFGGGHQVLFRCLIASTTLLYGLSPIVPIFWSDQPAICVRFHANSYNTPVNNHFWGGNAFVFTPQEAQAIIESHTPVVDPDPLLAVHPVAGGDIVVSYIDRWGDTKFKMRVAPTL